MLLIEMGDQYFSFEIHHGGQFVWNPQVTYVGGKVDYVGEFDPARLSLFEIRDVYYKMLGGTGAIDLYYRWPGYTLDTGLSLINGDADLMDPLLVMSSNGEILSSSPVMPSGLVIDLSDNDEGTGVKDFGAETVIETEVGDTGDENVTGVEEGARMECDLSDADSEDSDYVASEEDNDENGQTSNATSQPMGTHTDVPPTISWKRSNWKGNDNFNWKGNDNFNWKRSNWKGCHNCWNWKGKGAGSSQPPIGSSSQPVGKSTGRGVTGRGMGVGFTQPPTGSSSQPVGRSTRRGVTGIGAGRGGKASSLGPVGGPSLATVLQNIRAKKQARVTGMYLFDIRNVCVPARQAATSLGTICVAVMQSFWH
ncbi:hypothetical protein RHGRI_016670 [Rhododendron griersonianum]|uniref:PB1-like domain-containing protein n=1 Tax=Rhododendron griersonianum TaxID=479676 RepID=A0AAV6JVD7_9ERIC|nr:hypothetical protein RHGRI_016670 [Rhododendron griersonianum]